MVVLRHLVVVQMILFLVIPPFVLAAILGSEQWLAVVLPWGICCALLNDWARKRGLSTYSESKFLPIAKVGGTDRFHVWLLKFNACTLTLLFVAGFIRERL